MNGEKIKVMTKQGTTDPVPSTAGKIVFDLADEVMSLAESLSKVLSERLSPVINHNMVMGAKIAEEPTRELPPLFEQLRQKLLSIQNSLEEIQDIKYRLDI